MNEVVPSRKRRAGRAPRPRHVFVLLPALAASVIIVAACGDGDGTSRAEPNASEVADLYFEAVNDGDAAAAISLLTPDASFSNSFYGAYPRESHEQDLIWGAAQGASYVQPSCAEADADGQSADRGVTIVCETADLDAPSRAVDGPAVPVVMTMLISAEGIERIDHRYGSPDFRHVTEPFEAWMREHHPESAAMVGHSNWDTTEGARQNGLLTAEYAEAWAAYLQENNCTYLDGC